MSILGELPDWDAPSNKIIEPDITKKTSGWNPGERPPAYYFNWFWTRVSNALKILDAHNHDSLYYKKSEIDSKIQQSVASNEDLVESMYPIGSIYINATNNTNPGTLLGFGTWERFGEGRVLVSQDSTDADFDAIGETGGEKTHQLTESEMPSHNHNYTRVSGGYGGGGLNVDGSTSTVPTSLAGGDSPHNNLQPYITVYMWVRIS
jgi:hypothetical protein